MSKNLRFKTLLAMFALLLTFGLGIRAQAQPSSDAVLTSFSLLVPTVNPPGDTWEVEGDINEAAKTVSVVVPFGSTITNLVAVYEVSAGAALTHSEDPIIEMSDDPELDYTDPVAFTVTAEDGTTTVEYFVTVTVDENKCNVIGGILFVSTFNDCYNTGGEYVYDVSEEFVSTGDFAWEVDVPFGTDLTEFDLFFDPADECSEEMTVDADIVGFEDGVAVVITVTAENGIAMQDYSLTVNVGPASENNILGAEEEDDAEQVFYFPMDQFNGEAAHDIMGDVDQDQQRIDLVVPYNMNPYGEPLYDLDALIACFDHSAYSCVYVIGPETTDKTLQVSCETDNDFTEPVHYTVIAQNDAERYYNVYVEVADPDTDNSIAEIEVKGLENCNGTKITPAITDMGEGVFSLRLREGDDVDALTVEFEIDGDALAMPASGFVLGDEMEDNEVEIVVTAQSGEEMVYTIEVEFAEASDVKELVEFSFEPWDIEEETGNAQFIDGYVGTANPDNEYDITVVVPFDTDLTELVASFILNDEHASMTHSEDTQSILKSGDPDNHLNYETPVAFTVIAEDCSTVEYFVTVVPSAEKVGTALAFDLNGTQYDNCDCGFEAPVMTDHVDLTWTENAANMLVPAGTMVDSLTLKVVEDAVVSGLGVMVENVDDVMVYYMLDVSGTVEVTVTAPNGVDSETYTITIEEDEESDENMLLEFYFTKESNPAMEMDTIWGVIDEVKNRIDVEVPYGTPASLIVDFVQSPLACVFLNGEDFTAADEQCSGMPDAVDFSTYQTYTVVAQNGDEAYYNVYVEVLPADTQTWLADLTAHGLPECFGDQVYDIAADYDGTDITIEVLTDTDVTDLDVSFNVPEKATVMVDGDHVSATEEDGLFVITLSLDLSSDVEITVTPQDPEMDPVVYTVTAVEVDPSDEKMILTYSIGEANGTIDQTNKVIEVWVPWMTDVKDLVATFTLSDGAKMTHSEDTPILQVSGETSNNFITPVAYTVWAEDCSTLEYFVIVKVIPDTNTSISQFLIDYTGCFCTADDEIMKIDNYAKRIYLRIPFADENGQQINLNSLMVNTIGIAEGAEVDPAEGEEYDFSDGPVTFTVTAPDGVTKVAWEVFVDNPACTGTDILDWDFIGEDIQFEWTWTDEDDDEHVYANPIIDKENHTVTVMLVPGTDLTSLLGDATLECGATICCAAGNCAGSAIDFSGEGNCHTCVVTAQDKTVTQDWTICVVVPDVTKPEAFTESVLAHNCADSVMVSGDKDGGHVYIVDDETADAINTLVNGWTGDTETLEGLISWMAMNMEARAMLSSAVSHDMGSSAAYPYADSVVAVSTDGLYSGLYYAFLVDAAGNVSCASIEAVFIDQCVITVANLCDLRDGSDAFTYIVEGEVLVSYEEDDFKFIQDDGCGIKVVDELGAWKATYGEGAGLTNIKGTIDKSGVEMVFNPVCCYSPEESSTGNDIVPVELTWDEFIAQCYEDETGYESMLVRITDPFITVDDYDLGYTTWEADGLDLYCYNVFEDEAYLIQKVFSGTDYIGKEIPTVPTIYQGIRTNVDWPAAWGGPSGLLTPRKLADIIKVEAGILIADPDPATISNVVPATCAGTTISIINQGVGNLNITALYLDDAAGTDEFEIIDPEQVPFTLGTWESVDVYVEFCPSDPGDESTTLLVEYGDGKVMEVPINGSTVLIVDGIPLCQDFNGWPGQSAGGDGWSGNGHTRRYGSVGVAAVGPGNAYNFNGARFLVSPGIDLSDASTPEVNFFEGKIGIWGATASDYKLWVSTDFQASWTELRNIKANNVPEVYGADNPFQEVSVDLTDYVGEIVFLKWQNTNNGAAYSYYVIDNVCIREKVTAPIFTASPNPGDFGGVQVNESSSVTFTVTNTGVSVLNVKKIEIMAGPEFTMTDDNTYPTEVYNKDYAFAKNGGADHVSVDVTFSPTDIGVYTGKLLVTYGLYSDMVVEIPFSGEGLSCYTATEAFVGENWAASQNSWFTYTAEKFQIVNINSCHPNQDVSADQSYAYDTWLYVYADCEGTLIAENDDLSWDGCAYNRASSGVEFAMNEGETVKIFWPWEFDSAHDDEGFYFNIDPSYPIDGDVCETAIPLTLPVVNHFGSTVTFADDYDMSPCSPFSNYMDGNDKVYSIELDVEGYLTANILGAYGSVHVLDQCPVEELEKRNCKLFASGPNGGEQTKRIAPGFYYVIVSTWAPPQTVDYLLNMSFEELSTGIDDASIMSSLVVYPNPTQGMFTVSISSAEASDLTLELVSISGQTVYRNEVKSVYSYNEDIDASSFAKGVYYLKVNNGEEVKVEKVVIQ